ncbi:MAG TPA: hypothetical protein VME66_01010 [Candidatus Acidoferrales bacterium]|nr:hypothetical protein [Candidatus Acidoferrales bacterium]
MRKAIKALALVSALWGAAVTPASASPPLYVHPEDRSVGTDRPEAIVVARALLTQEWPASVQQVRVDATGTHLVAGIVLSGVKFHRALDVSDFLDEAQALIVRAFAAAPLEEVDLWATVPIRVARGAIVSGDLAVPTSRTVFACSVRRADLPQLTGLLHGSADVFWDEAFAAQLRAPAADTGEDRSQTRPIRN